MNTESSKTFLGRNYRSIISAFLLIIVTAAFCAGYLTGKREGGVPVTLSCSPDVLQKLAIPAITGTDETVGDAKVSATESDTPNLKNATLEAGMPTTGDVSHNNESATQTGKYVGSKNGTKYYAPECAGAKRIKPANKVWFSTAQDATLQGYSPATKC